MRSRGTPNHLSQIQIPVRYDSKATCPETEKFVVRVFPSGAVELAWDIYGHLMVPDTSMQKSFLLSGDGGNGKSTWLAALTAFLGRENISTISLQDLADTRFHGAELVGMLANICADLSGKQLAETGVFKKITGGDRITVERKYQRPFGVEPFARLVFSANSYPRGGDASKGFFDRWVVIPFEREFRGTPEQISRDELDARLAQPRELSGVLNRALGPAHK